MSTGMREAFTAGIGYHAYSSMSRVTISSANLQPIATRHTHNSKPPTLLTVLTSASTPSNLWTAHGELQRQLMTRVPVYLGEP
ncbi:hypothetical protein M426DRAFT_319727 [Hypoxylon sp. CI-4A]|nr:hypothetical protein M426DRAFT_319727 [Hypoxylon sp. CI-4A]